MMNSSFLCRGVFQRSTRICSALISKKHHAVVPTYTAISARRWCSGKGGDGISRNDENPVNVEEFTLKEDIVKIDLEAQRRWQGLAEKFNGCREHKAYEDIVAFTEEGLKLLEEVGDMRSPIQCRPLLWLEKAQAELNLERSEDANKSATMAKNLLESVDKKVQDAGRIAEVKELIAFATLRQGNVAKARALFEELLEWMDTDAKKAMPMVAVAAINMRPMVMIGVGMCLEAEAAKSDSKELYGKALDKLIDPLNTLIEGDDTKGVKDALNVIVRCFVGLGDQQKAVETCKKYVLWCKRHSDDEGVKAGKELMASLCIRFEVENPLIAIEKAEADAAKAVEEKSKAEEAQKKKEEEPSKTEGEEKTQ